MIAGTAIAGAMAVVAFGVSGSVSAKPIMSDNAVSLSALSATPKHMGGGKGSEVVATVLGLTATELRTQLDAGKTLAQVATAQGVAVQRVIDAIVAEKQAYLAQEVASGELTQAQADAKSANITTKVTEMVNTVRPAKPAGGRGGKSQEVVATVLGLTATELRTQLDAGKTLAQVATAQGVAVQRVIDAIVAEKQAYLAQEVASGELTQAQADAKSANITTKVTEMVNTVRPAKPAAGRGGRDGGRGAMRGQRMEGTTAPSTNS